MGTSSKYLSHYCQVCLKQGKSVCVDSWTAQQQEDHIKMHEDQEREALKQTKLFD